MRILFSANNIRAFNFLGNYIRDEQFIKYITYYIYITNFTALVCIITYYIITHISFLFFITKHLLQQFFISTLWCVLDLMFKNDKTITFLYSRYTTTPSLYYSIIIMICGIILLISLFCDSTALNMTINE